MKKGNPKALLPIGIFLVLYLGLGILLEYILGIEMGFYNIPIIAVFMVALAVAVLQNPKLTIEEKTEIMGKGVGDRNVMIMILILFMAGMFSSIVGRSSAQSVAYFLLKLVPGRYAVAMIFVIACVVSMSMGTSVGTITLIIPIAVEIANASGFDVALCVGTLVSGAMFGDNLSFISDTTIAACNGQGCTMKDKFRENFGIALPAAFATLLFIVLITAGSNPELKLGEYNLLQVLPYVLVLIGGVIGIDAFIVLFIGIVSGTVIMLLTGAVDGMIGIFIAMGNGISGMYETATVALLVSAMCALIREYGGFDAVLYGIRKVFKGKKGVQLGMGILVGVMDIATANNTVAIVVANPIAKEMSAEYGISSSKTASLLDTFSCVVQGLLPYGAQILVAISQTAALGYTLSAFDIIPYMFYPYLLLLSSLIFIYLVPERKY